MVATTTFLADIAQNVAGGRAKIESLIPIGVEPHGFEPTAADIRTVSDADVLIVNGHGMEAFLDKLLSNAGGKRTVIEASSGLAVRTPQPGELTQDEHQEGDPHFWLDPNLVITYTKNIRDGLSSADPDGAGLYATNAQAYIDKLQELDIWVRQQVAAIPQEQRLLVTNHETFGYFADRYGFHVVGTIVPSISPEASPSAQQLVRLVEQIKKTGAPAIFLETGTNPKVAEQVSKDAGVKVVTGLYTHSVSEPKGEAPTYLEMIRYDVRAIVGALRQ